MMSDENPRQGRYEIFAAWIVPVVIDGGERSSRETDDFSIGKSMAYYDVMTNLIDAAKFANIPLEELGIAGYDPDIWLRPVVNDSP